MIVKAISRWIGSFGMSTSLRQHRYNKQTYNKFNKLFWRMAGARRPDDAEADLGQNRARHSVKRTSRHGHRLYRTGQYGAADGAPADRGRAPAHGVRHAARGGRSARRARRD